MAQHDGEIPILDRGTGAAVGAILWRGTEAAGVWAFQARGRASHQAEADLQERIAQARKSFAWLRQLQYIGRGFVRQAGWHGFWGTANALEYALPYVGLLVDWNAMRAPIAGATPPADLLIPPSAE